MFDIVTPKVGSVVSPAESVSSLASVGGEIRQNDFVRTQTMPSLRAPEASSKWMEWVLSGQLGDFLGWTGEKLAEIGREVVSTPSIAERKRSKQVNRVALLQAFSDMVLEENTGEEKSLLLQAYLRDVLVLLQSGYLSPSRLKRELSELLRQAEAVPQVRAVSVLSDWLANLNKISPAEEISISEEKTESKRELRNGFSATVDVSGLTGANGFSLDGTGFNTELGYSVSAAGDINGDKYDDFVVGGAPDSNLAHIVFGSPTTFSALPGGIWDLASTPLTGANGFTVIGETSSDWFGTSVSSAGDINGDGYDDVVIGAPYAPNGAGPGRAYVIFGAPTATFAALGGVRDLSTRPLTGSDGFTLSGINDYDFLGFSVSEAGDVNGDGYDDIIVGAIYAPYGAAPGGGPGQASVIFGASGPTFAALPGGIWDLSTIPLTGSNGFTITGVRNGDAFGSSVSGAGDLDRDGYHDVIVGAPQAGSLFAGGEAQVIFGAPTSTFVGLNGNFDLATTTLTGMNGFSVTEVSVTSQLGAAVSQAGDVNRDGFADILVGAPDIPFGYSSTGIAYVIFGAPKATFAALPNAILYPNLLTGPNGFTIAGIAVYDQLGFSVSEAGDVNGDGYDDMIVGAVNAPYGSTPYPGQAYVIYGAAQSEFSTLPNAVLDVQTLTGTNGFTINGIVSGNKLGYSVHAAGDVNGDGVDDIIVGAPFTNTVDYSGAGQAHVIFGISSSSGGTTSTGLNVDVNRLKIKQGKRVLITTSQLSASLAGASADNLLFTVSYGGKHDGSIHGYFEYGSNKGTPIYQFTQADIEANRVNFVHNGGEYPPNYAINVCYGDASLPVQVKFHFRDSRRDVQEREVMEFLDDEHLIKQFVSGGITTEDLSKQKKPGNEQKESTVSLPKAASSGSLTIVNHDIEIKRNGKHRVRLSELSATGGSVSDDALKFTIDNNFRRHEHGYFKDISQLGEARQFTQADIRAGNIYFIHDMTHDEPSYAVSVSDGECTIPETVVVDFYNRHGNLLYSGRPAGASSVRSDEGLMPAGEMSDARLLNQVGFLGEITSRANRPRMESHKAPQADLRLGKVA